MADFPPKLDDGELYLPSDIFPDEIIYTRENPTNSNRKSPDFPCELTYMEDLAQQLAAYALVERNLSQQVPKPHPNASQFGQSHSLHSSFGLGGYTVTSRNGATGFGNGGFRPGSRPGCQFYPVKPSPAQLESFVHARARVLQRQQQNPVHNRFFPFRISKETGTSGFVRESGGTGVFLPRVVVNSDNRKKPTMKTAVQTPPMGNAGKQGMAFQHPSSDMGLPQDWTY